MLNKINLSVRKVLWFVCLIQVASTLLLSVETSAATLNVPSQYATVQAAFNAAQPGDTILLAAGTYDEKVSTVQDGTASQRVILDGQNAAILRKFTFKHSYITVKNMIFSGLVDQFSGLVNFYRGGHYNILTDSILDAGLTPDVYGINWQGPSSATKPFGDGSVASNCLIQNTEIKNVLGSPMLNMFGDNNRFINNHVHDGAVVDFVRLWGRNNYIGYNIFYNNYDLDGVGNHPDFIQTFGENGHGSQGHMIEGNLIKKSHGQFSQLEHTGVPEIRDWTFRNNIVVEVDMQASVGIPGVKFYNNVFYRCNKVNKGHVLYFGQSSIGSKAHNNVFLDNGGDSSGSSGWYHFNSILTDVTADYNYVAKVGYVPVTQDSQQRPIGNSGGWDSFRWWEPHGINGGDPKLTTIYSDCVNNTCNFHPQAGSFLIDAGLDLSAVWSAAKDYDNVSRPQGAQWDIGPFEYAGQGKVLLSPPFNLRIIP